MLKYRYTALVLPAALLLLLPALAAYSWQMPFGGGLALPFLTLLTILFSALRYPGLMLSPLVFASGLACDLFTRSPLGYWTLLFLITLSCAHMTTLIVERRGRLAGWLCFCITVITMSALAWFLASLYQFEWQELRKTVDGMIMALVILPFPALFLVGLENLLILKRAKKPSRSFGPVRR